MSLWFKFDAHPRGYGCRVEVRCDAHAPAEKPAPPPKNNAWADGQWRRLDEHHPDYGCDECREGGVAA